MAPSGMMEQQSVPESHVTLDPALLSVSCERIKDTLLRTLHQKDNWKGKIHVRVNPLAQPNRNIVLTSTRFLDGWRYHLEIPETVDADKLIRAVTQALLLEIAHRQHRGLTSTEIPTWLIEGLTMRLKKYSVSNLVLDRNNPFMIRETQPDPMKEARSHFLTHSPLSIEQLGFHSFDESSPEWETFQHTAHLLAHSLLDQPSGPRSMTEFVVRLPKHENWQLALIDAFTDQFNSMRDFEKWWVIITDQFQSANRWRQIPFGESLQKIQQVLALSARMRPEEIANVSTVHTNLSFAHLLSQWPVKKQEVVLQEKLKELTALQPNLDPRTYPLLQSYVRTIQDYLIQLGKVGRDPVQKGEQPLRREWVAEEFQNRIANLDQQRRMQLQGGAPPSEQ